MKQLIIEGLWSWSQFNVEKQMDFNGHLWVRPDGNVLIDPPPLSAGDREHLDSLGGVALCIVTNADHQRGLAQLHEELAFEVACHADDADALDVPVNRRLQNGDEIVPGLVAVHMPHGKTPGEIALLFVDISTILFGDIIQGVPAGGLRILPDEKLADPTRASLALRKLLPLQLQNIIVGDGLSLFGSGHQALFRCLTARGDIDVYRINREELGWSTANNDPRYQHEIKNISNAIGAQQLGYNIRRLPPGAVSGPMHYHRNQEEFFYVLDGQCTLERPTKKLELRAGDFISCLAGEEGAHSVRNNSDAPCTILCVSNQVAHDERELVGLVDFRHDLISP